MKKIISVSALVLIIVSVFSFSASCQKARAIKTVVTNSTKVEVYYFHFTRRCATCQAVETESKKAIAALYPAQSKKGLITFKSVNLDEKGTETLAKKCNAEGQALLVIKGNKRNDLTDKGFMYALNNPEKLKVELKKAIDPLL